MPSGPDYLAVTVPPEKDPSEYTWVERRADLLNRIITAGSPRAIHQARLAAMYEVSEGQLSQDMDRLAADITTHLAADLDLSTFALYEHTVEHLHEQGKYKQAWDVHLEWLDFLDGVRPVNTDARTDTTPPSTGGDSEVVTEDHQLTPEAEAHFDALIERARQHNGQPADDSHTVEH